MIIRIMYISCKKSMMKALKRNQIVIFAIALMLITAGYLNYTMKTEQTAETSSITEDTEIAGIGDAKLVSSNNVSIDNTSINNVIQNTTENISNSISTEENTNSINNVSSTSTKTSEDLEKYFTESRLEREKMYSEMLESYQSILANSSVSADQKNTAQTEISNINSQKNAIMIAENLIKNKGFEDIVIFANNGSISVVVRADNLEEAEIAQIQSIIQRELGVNVENIHISNK